MVFRPRRFFLDTPTFEFYIDHAKFRRTWRETHGESRDATLYCTNSYCRFRRVADSPLTLEQRTRVTRLIVSLCARQQ